jgi:hypothetical protein
MKKIIVLLGIMLFAYGSRAIGRQISDIVVSDGITYFGDKVIPGPSNIKLFDSEGQITKLPNQTVESFIRSGQVFVKLPVITKSNDTVGLAFMQYITSRSGLQLFRYCSKCLQFDPLEGEIAPINPVYRYYIFKGGKYLMLLDEKDTDTFLSFFGVKVIA